MRGLELNFSLVCSTTEGDNRAGKKRENDRLKYGGLGVLDSRD